MKKLLGPLILLLLGAMVLGLAHTARAAEEKTAPKPDEQVQQAMQYYREGIRAARAGAYEEAINWFKASLRLRPGVAPTYFSLGYTLEKLGRLSEAERVYRQVISMEPTNYKAHYNLGNALESQGKLAEAEKAYLEAIRLNPKADRAHNSLAWLWVSAKDPARRHIREALPHALEAVRLTERMDATSLDTLAEIYYAMGQCLKAVWTEEEAVNEEPGEATYKKSLKRFKLCRDAGWAARDGDMARARKLWREVIAIAPDDWRARGELARLGESSSR